MTISTQPDPAPDPVLAVAQALARATDHLLDGQEPGGWWRGVLCSNVTMDAEDLLMRHFLGILRVEQAEQSARWLRSQQRGDGSWATFPGGPADLSTTVEAYVALKLAGDDPADRHMLLAREVILASGGLAASRVFTRIWLAMLGQWPWSSLPSLPPEILFLPTWAPLNIYNWACWARQTIVPLTIIATLRPVRPLPFDLDELHSDGAGASAGSRAAKALQGSHATGLDPLGLAFHALDGGLKLYGRLPGNRLRAWAIRRAGQWTLDRQEADGGWGGIQPPIVYSIIALHLCGYRLDGPELSAALAGVDGFVVHESAPDGPIRWLEACQSPVWDTSLALTALLDAGLPADHPALNRAGQWLLTQEVTVRGDWAVRRPDLPPGGWAFEFANAYYPDIDDTAEAVLVLHRLRRSVLGGDEAIRRAVRWTLGMQCRDGGWAAFDADNTHRAAEKVPFSDFGAVIDPPSADVTAHIVEMLAHLSQAGTRACQRAVQWLLDAQEPDGSWFGRWGVNHVYGTGAVVPALIAAGVRAEHPAITRAVVWLVAHQNPDGGWGEDIRSYTTHDWRGRGPSTPSQTAWALLALLAADPTASATPAIEHGIVWLVAHQNPEGDWGEDLYTGTGFPGDFYLGYQMYRTVFPISALGRYHAAVR